MARSGAYRTYVDGRWGQIHIRVAGPATGPTVVLLHKMVWSSLEFEKVQPLLAARGIRSIAIDLPGYGLSDGPEDQPSSDDYADALLPVFDALGVRKAIVAGVDTGATLAVSFGLRHPGRTRSVILEGPAIFHGEALARVMAEPEFDRTGRPGGAEYAQRWAELKAMAGPRHLGDAAIQRGLQQFFQAGPHYLYGHRAIFSYDLEHALPLLRVPVLLLTYPGDQLNAQALAVKRANPHFRLVSIAYDGMAADWQAPAPWAEAVADEALAAR